jgi:amidase
MAIIDSDLAYLEAHELADLIRTREVSSLEATQVQLARIEATDPSIRSFALVMADMALKDAQEADVEIAVGRHRGPLHGVPIGIKDLCWTADVPTAAGMAVHRDFLPEEDATVVRRLRESGAVILGKVQLTEGAYSDYHPSVAPPLNPWWNRFAAV